MNLVNTKDKSYSLDKNIKLANYAIANLNSTDVDDVIDRIYNNLSADDKKSFKTKYSKYIKDIK